MFMGPWWVMAVSVRSIPMEPRSSMWMAGAWGWSIGGSGSVLHLKGTHLGEGGRDQRNYQVINQI